MSCLGSRWRCAVPTRTSLCVARGLPPSLATPPTPLLPVTLLPFRLPPSPATSRSPSPRPNLWASPQKPAPTTPSPGLVPPHSHTIDCYRPTPVRPPTAHSTRSLALLATLAHPRIAHPPSPTRRPSRYAHPTATHPAAAPPTSSSHRSTSIAKDGRSSSGLCATTASPPQPPATCSLSPSPAQMIEGLTRRHPVRPPAGRRRCPRSHWRSCRARSG